MDIYRYNNRTYRIQLVAGFAEAIKNLVDEGWDATYVNFMFKHIVGSEYARKQVMIGQVHRVHDILTRHIVRKPHAPNWRHLRPFFIGSPDYPIAKERKLPMGDLRANDGLHINFIALTPPASVRGVPMREQFEENGRMSRLKVPLRQHFADYDAMYRGDWLERIWAAEITRGTMADYTLKAFKKGRISYDELVIM